MLYQTRAIDGQLTYELVDDCHDDWCGYWSMAPVIKHLVERCREFKGGPNMAFVTQGNGTIITEEEYAAGMERQSAAFKRIERAMQLIIEDNFDGDDDLKAEVQDGFDLLAKYWEALWT